MVYDGGRISGMQFGFSCERVPGMTGMIRLWQKMVIGGQRLVFVTERSRSIAWVTHILVLH